MYKALKPCTLAGRKFIIDDEIPADLVLNPQKLIKRGTIVHVNDEVETYLVPEVKQDEVVISIPVYNNDEVINISLSAEQIVEVVTILQHTVDEAKEVIKNIASEDELIVIHRLDSRKGVKEVAEDRANELEEAKANADSNTNGDNDPDGSGDDNGDGNNGSNNTAGDNNDGNNANGSGEE